MLSSSASIVTHQAVLARLMGIMTGHAPTHLERRHLFHALHALDLAVTGLAGDPGPDMALVIKSGESGQGVHANPRNRLSVFPVGLDFF